MLFITWITDKINYLLSAGPSRYLITCDSPNTSFFFPAKVPFLFLSIPPSSPHRSHSVHSSCPCTISCRNTEYTLYTFLAKDLQICKLTAVNVVDVEERVERQRRGKGVLDGRWAERDCFSY